MPANVFDETLRPGMGMHGATLLLVPMVALAAAPFGPLVSAISAALITLAALLALHLSAPRVTVAKGFLTAGKIRVPLSALGAAEAFSAEAAFSQRGPKLDARAAKLLKGDVDGVVRIEITDPLDPTPYLLISTRRPVDLIEALSAAVDSAD